MKLPCPQRRAVEVEGEHGHKLFEVGRGQRLGLIETVEALCDESRVTTQAIVTCTNGLGK